MKVVTVTNQKGGVGKTTTVTSLASILTDKGYKVLIIDADDQCNASDTYRAQIDDAYTLSDLILTDKPCAIEDAIQHTPYGDIIAGDDLLESADIVLKDKEGAAFSLKESLSRLQGYDYVLIDTHPSVNMILDMALAASDSVIIPLAPERYSIKGLSKLTNTIYKIKTEANSKLKIDGILFVAFNPRHISDKNAREVMYGIAEDIGTEVFKTYIRPTAANIRKAQGERLPLNKFDSKCTAALDYVAFADEWISKEDK